MRKLNGLFLVALFWAVPAVMAYEDHDQQLQVELAAGGKLGGGFEAGLSQLLKYSSEFNEFYEQEVSIFLNWEAYDWLKLGVGYKEVNTRKNAARYMEVETDGLVDYTESEDHTWVREARPYLQAVLKGKFSGWKVSNRNRFEWRDKEWRAPYLRYRNRLKVTGPWQWTPWKIAAYALGEIFFEDDKLRASSDRLDRTRWTAGVSMKPVEYFSFSPGILYEWNKKEGAWTDLYSLTLNAKLYF